jgi:hypothetical protein
VKGASVKERLGFSKEWKAQIDAALSDLPRRKRGPKTKSKL